MLSTLLSIRFLKTREGQVLSLFSLLAALASLLYFCFEALVGWGALGGRNETLFLLGLAGLDALILGALCFFMPAWHREALLAAWTKLLLAYAPAALVVTAAMALSGRTPYLFEIFVGGYVILAGSRLAYRYTHRMRTAPPILSASEGGTERPGATPRPKERLARALLVLLFTGTFLGFGLQRLADFAAVDEPLWLEGRISKFWNNMSDREWAKTSISDKPGITVALVSGPGLITHDPKEFDTPSAGGEIRIDADQREQTPGFFLAFRLPLLVFIAIVLPLFYVLLVPLVGPRAALFSYGFIATSPILVGMSKIVNPDSLLWLFAPLSLLAYFAFRATALYRYLVLAGVFVGLALLTKYVANILFIFFLVIVFAEYLYRPRDKREPLADYLRTNLADLLLLLFVALATFYLLFPAVWVEPTMLLSATLLSQAFAKVAPLFLLLLLALIVDQGFNRARVTGALLGALLTVRRPLALVTIGLFFVSALATLVSVWRGMQPFNFMEYLASPKHLYRHDIVGGFLTNFYPLLFGILPWVLFFFLAALLILLFSRNWSEHPRLRLVLYLSVLILIYYVGGTVNGVAAIVRYQIMIFPLAAIIAGIGLSECLAILGRRCALPRHTSTVVALLILLAGGAVLARTPFPLSYASSLLPDRYFTDLKDMGPGSYEMAQALNALPDAQALSIWTDKDGVCQFFVGRCFRGFGRETLAARHYDYIVVSAARQKRTSDFIERRIVNAPETLYLTEFYERTDPDIEILINDRPAHFVRAFRFAEEK